MELIIIGAESSDRRTNICSKLLTLVVMGRGLSADLTKSRISLSREWGLFSEFLLILNK